MHLLILVPLYMMQRSSPVQVISSQSSEERQEESNPISSGQTVATIPESPEVALGKSNLNDSIATKACIDLITNK